MEPVFLRALEAGDVQRTHKWHNDAHLYESLGGAMRFVSRAAEEQWLLQKQGFNDREVNLAICVTGAGDHIGNIYLRDIDWIARRAELHILIGEENQRGRGHGRSAVGQLVSYAFGSLGLQKVYLYVLVDNAAAIRAYEKCGFVTEGTLRRHALKAGVFKDVLVMAVYASNEARHDTT